MLLAAQKNQLTHYGVNQCIDLHCHCLPGLDDGPSDMDKSIALCTMLVIQGITTVVATPHQLGLFDGDYTAGEIIESVAQLNQTLTETGIPLTVLPGAEIRIDERIPALLEMKQLLTMGHTQTYVLLELPYDIFLDIGPLLERLNALGYRSIIAHPERNRRMAQDPHCVLAWAEYEPILQLTAASIIGQFGQRIQQAAHVMLDMQLPVLVANDAHDTQGRRPCFAEAFEMVSTYRGPEKARQLFIEMPHSILYGKLTSALRADSQRRTSA